MAFVKVAWILSLLAAPMSIASAEDAAANPIRKVVSMLQSMQKKITAEGEKEAALYEKFMCYCKNGKSDLEASISSSDAAVPQLGHDIEEKEAKLAQTKEDLKSAQQDRSDAKAAIADATAIREKEAAAYASEKTEYETNIAAIKSATSAISKGLGGAFLQSNTVKLVLKAINSQQDMLDGDRQELVSFLSGSQSSFSSEDAPGSAEIVGLLKQLGDEMSASLASITKDEEVKVASFTELVAAKKKEIAALTSQIETKTGLVGDLGVEIVSMKGDLSKTEAALIADKKFLANLDSDCATKTTEWEEIQKTRSEELVAVAETIKILNDDEALEIFKKTLPSASASSLMQVKVATDRKAKALAAIQQSIAKSHNMNRPRLDFIALALHGKKIGFEKVIKMIDAMSETLKTEQLDDDHKKEYCASQFDVTEDKIKALKGSVSDLEPKIADTEDSIAALAAEIKDLETGIAALDKSVQEATEQRKSEHEDFLELMSSDSQAKELLEFAKTRLNKFYNPELYKATTLLQISSKAAPPPAPAAPGPYSTKSAESTGVIAMIDKMIKGLSKEMTEAEVSEKNAQEEYEALMGDSAAKRASDGASITEKTSAKANLGAELEADKESKTSTEKEAMATEKYMASLHAECDWLIKYYSVRAEARTGEIDSLDKAKAVLSGADYSLMQTRSRRFLKRA
mmetsp:Transcript_147068/g.259951  ORF Transcript_147068/g.259951 Transcript_147068/m.259951 type:complete len:687 (+) Transcript_147068:71-2131(+)